MIINAVSQHLGRASMRDALPWDALPWDGREPTTAQCFGMHQFKLEIFGSSLASNSDVQQVNNHNKLCSP